MLPIAIIGGGIAGLSSAYQLARRGADVVVLERERLLCTHSSGRNAAIFRSLEPAAHLIELALKSRKLLDDLCGADAWLNRTGALYVARVPDALRPLLVAAEQAHLDFELLGRTELHDALGALRGGDAFAGIRVDADGVIDIHLVAERLAAEARAAGALIRTGAEVRDIEQSGDAFVVHSEAGKMRASAVVLAAGAWCAELGQKLGAPLPLQPLRRHLAQLVPTGDSASVNKIIWRIDDEVYLRPEGPGWLASPCDETPAEPGEPATDAAVLETLGEKLVSLAPVTADAQVQRSWPCLRTFAPDRDLVVGQDPRRRGLFWLGGLGGHGMTLGLAAGDVLAAAVLGTPHRYSKLLSPDRLLADLAGMGERPPSVPLPYSAS